MSENKLIEQAVMDGLDHPHVSFGENFRAGMATVICGIAANFESGILDDEQTLLRGLAIAREARQAYPDDDPITSLIIHAASIINAGRQP